MAENTDKELMGQAWNSAKIYHGSNIVGDLNAIVDTKSIRSIGNYAQTKACLENFGVSGDAKVDDRLLKYTLAKITPTQNFDKYKKTETTKKTEMYLISDEHGHDIGVCEMGEDGQILSFTLSPKIEENNKQVIEQKLKEKYDKLREGITDSEKLKELKAREAKEREKYEGMYKVGSYKELVEKLAKGDRIALASVEQLQDDIAKNQSEEMRTISGKESDIEKTEDSEEEQAIESIPADMRAEVIQKCREQGISIKQVIVVDCPKCLSEEVDNSEVGIRSNGGPVILVQAKNQGTELSDDLYMFQDGKQLQNSTKDKDRVIELMEQHKGEGAVIELDDTKKEVIMKAILEKMEEYDKRVKDIQEGNYATEEDRTKAIMQAGRDTVGEIKSIISYEDYVPDKEVTDLVQGLEKNTEKPAEQEQDDGQRTIYGDAESRRNNHTTGY